MPLNCYVGWTPEGALAYRVCKATLIKHSTIDIKVIPLIQWDLRYRKLYRRPYIVTANGQRVDAIDGTPFSTDFSFTRFLIPCLEKYASHWSFYCDSDMLWLDDIAKIYEECVNNNLQWDIACVKHNWIDSDNVKMHGHQQVNYKCKNWSSLMMIHCRRCSSLNAEVANTATGRYLHQFEWVRDESYIGSLDPRWNVLHGEKFDGDPAVVHFTRGTPDMPIHACQDKWSEMWTEESRKLII